MNIPEIAIEGLRIGPEQRPFIIAEMSGNHNGSLDRALAIVDAAAKAGAQAIKIQTYTADTMTLDLKEGPFYIDDPDSLWKGHSLYELYQKAYTPWEWHGAIFDRCRKKGVLCFSTPFDATAVDFLETFNVPLYKIASFENIDIPLIRKVASTGKPLIISTGMATLDELKETVEAARQAGCRDLILLKCASAYPAPPESINLMTIPDLQRLFQCQVGLSDHTLGIGISLASVALGASVIERHVTLDRHDGGVDSTFSLEPAELSQLVSESARVWKSKGNPSYGPTPEEKGSLRFRRSLYIAKDMKALDILTPENLRAVRPGFGLPPKYYEQLLGKRIRKDAKKGTPVQWDLVETQS